MTPFVDGDGYQWWFLDLGNNDTLAFTTEYYPVVVFRTVNGRRIYRQSKSSWRDSVWACQVLNILTTVPIPHPTNRAGVLLPSVGPHAGN